MDCGSSPFLGAWYQAQALTETIRAAENRLAVALAVVEGSEPPDDGGGTELAA